MKKSNFVGGKSTAGTAKTLSQQEMEHELDHCPAPWKCPARCYKACTGCVRKQEPVDEAAEMEADLMRKYGNKTTEVL